MRALGILLLEVVGLSLKYLTDTVGCGEQDSFAVEHSKISDCSIVLNVVDPSLEVEGVGFFEEPVSKGGLWCPR